MEHTTTLTRGGITLRPLSTEDAPAFRALADAGSWAGMSDPLPADDAAMASHLSGLIERPDALCFAVEKDGRLVGRTTYYDLVPRLRVEIGNTLYAREAWGSEVNPTCKLLLLEHAFAADGLGVGRVALRCDHRNTRSHRAIARLGARFEGTLRAFRPAADGTIADVDYFSVLAGEWPAVREGLEARLAR
ncbi:GNAT family N-acetyltransferase [Brachybacterium endophyticum]|uniref:GNAT family N-acetyltransferase n=1 Tax=Brachybacterium endophyticum TaxID=2182385 RepID=A0A2U2RPA0_9MICO|nr:GNAT family protein [Brachybacterium endophyticum]PWH07702.1 GNAT family N-acetyltransferase [Brachybacterium endophyticum]